jgi:flagellar biosynthesis protein FliR
MALPLQFDPTWMLTTMLVWVRLGALFAFSPLVTAAKVPVTFLVLLTLCFAGLITSALSLRTTISLEPGSFALAVLTEMALGALLGFALHCAFAAFALAGHLLDVQMGFGIGSIYDPVTQANTPVIGSTLALFGVALFFAVNGHHMMLRGITFSLSAVPPGGGWAAVSAMTLLRPVGAMFTAGVSVVAPVLLVLLLTEVALGITSRVLPQINVFFVGIPAKILVGLTTLALVAPAIGPAMTQAYAGIFRFWSEVLR